MTHEQKFLHALKDVFIGAPVEGESGYINLMRIKARYFEQGIAPRLLADVRAALAPFPAFREELFDKLYSFFHRYFSESGSIYFRYTPLHQNVYARVYTDDRDVMLFWKTHMLYYVKTDRLFQNMEVQVDNFTFYFDVSALQHKQANEKRALVFDFAEERADGASGTKLVFTVTYSERGSKTKMDDLQKALRAHSKFPPREDVLERAFRLFERQSEVDYFINKDARAFLREQFDLWMYQYVFSDSGATVPAAWTATRVQQLQVLRDIAYKLIDFIAQFEDELVKVWNKPKFARGSHYVITLDRIASASPLQDGEGPGVRLLRRVLAHPGMAAQAAEWRALGMVDAAFTPDAVWQQDLFGQRLDAAYQYLPLDTRHFPDVELDILGLFDDLDEALDGWLVHSENYQALRTLEPKFRGQVKCIYIDPPYNTAASEILYNNNYKHSSWITFMENRIELSRYLLSDDGVKIVAIDDTEMVVLSQLLDTVFSNYDRSVVVVNHHPAGAGLEGTNISTTHEYAVFMTPRGKKVLYGEKKGEGIGRIGFIRTGTAESNLRIGRPNSFYAVLVDPKSSKVVGAERPPIDNNYPRGETEDGLIRVYPTSADGTERVWRRSYESCLKEIASGNIECQNNRTLYLLSDDSDKHKPIFSNWTDTKYNAGAYGTNVLTDILGSPIFSYPKSIFNVMDCISSATIQEVNPLIVDYFAGSGTTAHAVMNLNREDGGRRKYILVEMGDHFETVILPRVKKVAFSDSWKDGQAQPGGQGLSHFVKVYRLEQYEDALRLARYEDADLFHNPYADPYSSYVFLRDLKMLEAVDLDTVAETVTVHLDRLYPDIDLAETLSCVTGKPIKRITAQEVEFRDGTRADLLNPEWDLVKPLIWW